MTGGTGPAVLRGAVAGQRRDLGTAAVLASAHQAGEALVPILIGVVIDTAVTTGSVPALMLWIGVLAATFAVLSTSFRYAARAAERAAENAAHDLRLRLVGRILDARGGATEGRLSGELVSTATGDAKRVGAIHLTLPFGIAALVAVVVGAVALLSISVPLGLLVLIGTPPLLVLTRLVGRPLERRTEVEQERAAHASGVATDLVAGLRVLKGIGAEAAAVDRYRRTSQASLAATLRAARTQAAHDGTVLALTGSFIAVVALVGGRLAATGEISVGELVAASGLALFLLDPLAAFGWVNAELSQARASAGRIAAVLGAPVAVAGGTGRPAGPVRGSVRLRGLTHGALRRVDLHVEAGELLGVVAASPAVATALLQCLARDADPAEGRVELDGVPLTDLDPESVRAAVLVAAHDADLFAGTLAENVSAGTAWAAGIETAGIGKAAIGHADIGHADIGHADIGHADIGHADIGHADIGPALAAAAADEVAASLPAGLDTPVRERGRSLSGGQRQRVALARALATDAPVLVLHDPTTAVDSVTEARIAGALRELRRRRTTVVVTTSPALLAVVDRVVVLDGAGVRIAGPHAELVGADEAYRAAVLS